MVYNIYHGEKMKTIKEFVDKCIIVRIPIGILRRITPYEATRRCWRASLTKVKNVKYVLGIDDGKVICVIEVKSCDYVENDFCEKEEASCKNDFGEDFGVGTKKCNGRIAFEGVEKKDDEKYLNKYVPDEFLPRQNPVRYTF
jgi:hypothetical protein